MWIKNHYKDRENPEFTKPVHDITGLLERVEKFGDAGDASERLQNALLTYLIAKHGIGSFGSDLRLDEGFPSHEKLNAIGSTLNRPDGADYEEGTLSLPEYTELEEESKSIAKGLLRSEYADLCSPEIIAWAGELNSQQQSFRWSESDDSVVIGGNHYNGGEDSGHIRSADDVIGFLELNNKSNYLQEPRRPQDARLAYTIAVHGIGVLGDNFTNLPDNFPSREKIERLGWSLEFQKLCSDETKCNELIEQSKVFAKELLLNEFVDLCSPEILTWAGGQDQSKMVNGNNRTFTSMKEVLDGISKGSIDPLMFDKTQKTGIQLYLVAQHGIEVSSYLTELPDDYPYRDRFQPIVEQMAFEENYLELHRLNESSKSLAENILEKDFPSVFEELKANRQAENSQENSYRWPENDDFLNENEQGLKM